MKQKNYFISTLVYQKPGPLNTIQYVESAKLQADGTWKSLRENENRIVSELNTIQVGSINIGGYYKPNENLVNHAMRPSKVFNRILE